MKNTIIDTYHGQALSECPVEAFELHSGPVCFADGEGDDGAGNHIRLQLCDGSISAHWFWGNMAFNLGGITLAKERIPILFAHDTDQRLGMSTGHSTEPAFVLEGDFLSNTKAAEIKQDVKDGFEFESSLRFDMDKGVITHVKEGESVIVNGHRLEGPGTVFEKSTIMEGSICVFGAQDNCSTKVFSEIKNRKEKQMSKISLEQFKADNPELFAEIVSTAHAGGKAEGIQGQIVLFGEIQKACPDPVVAAKCFAESLTVEASEMAYLKDKNDKLEKSNTELTEKAAGGSTETAAEKKAAEVLKGQASAAATEFTDNADDPKNKGGGGGDKLEKDMTVDELKAVFAASKELQNEFGKEKVGAYLAFVEHNSQGDINILKK